MPYKVMIKLYENSLTYIPCLYEHNITHQLSLYKHTYSGYNVSYSEHPNWLLLLYDTLVIGKINRKSISIKNYNKTQL